MIVICTNCSSRLQLDKAKVPARPFSVRCPKCQQIINAHPPAAQPQQGAVAAVGDLPVSTRSQQEMSAKPSAPLFSGDVQQVEQSASSEGDVLRALAALLQRESGEGAGLRASAEQRRRVTWGRRAMVCAGSAYREAIARGLADDGYNVVVAPDAAHALEQMREERVDVVVLDHEFDAGKKGAASVAREIGSLRMPERRRVVFVQLADNTRTGDAHAAFLAGVNLIVNTSGLHELPAALEKNLRDLNDLYRNFNKALGLSEI